MALSPETRAAVRRLIAKCDADSWSPSSLDFSAPRPILSPADEETVLQYLADFRCVEQMAGAFFAALRDKVDDPSLRELLSRFVDDEVRHAEALELLARFHDTGRRRYEPNPSLVRFVRSLDAWIGLAPTDAAAIGVTIGEVAFDIAYLGPLESFMGDPTTRAVLARIHRDEARHLALDYLLLDALPALAPSSKSHPWDTAKLAFYWARVLAIGFPFMRTTFFETTARLDPNGESLRDAARRVQLAMERPEVRRRPMGRIYGVVQTVFDSPVTGGAVRALLGWLLNAPPEVFRAQASHAERLEHQVASAAVVAEHTWSRFAGRSTN